MNKPGPERRLIESRSICTTPASQILAHFFFRFALFLPAFCSILRRNDHCLVRRTDPNDLDKSRHEDEHDCSNGPSLTGLIECAIQFKDIHAWIAENAKVGTICVLPYELAQFVFVQTT